MLVRAMMMISMSVCFCPFHILPRSSSVFLTDVKWGKNSLFFHASKRSSRWALAAKNLDKCHNILCVIRIISRQKSSLELWISSGFITMLLAYKVHGCLSFQINGQFVTEQNCYAIIKSDQS